jgi:hypothetical protein
MFSIKVTTDRRGVKNAELFMKNMMRMFYIDMTKKMESWSEAAVLKMVTLIAAGRKRPDLGTHLLENSIKYNMLDCMPSSVIFGIGNIDEMNINAPYWNVLDAGGYVPYHGNLVPYGIFAPGTPNPDTKSFRQGNWDKGGNVDGKKFTFKATKPIEGLNYISISTSVLVNTIETEIKGFIESEIQKLKKV